MESSLKKLPSVVPFLLLCICQAGANQPTPVDDLNVYLLIGGSTMAGQAEILDQDLEILDRCYLLNAEGKWEPANAPLNRNSSIRDDDRIQRLGPGYRFAKAMLEADENISIGLVVNAGTGSKIEDWTLKSHYFREARRRTLKQALKNGGTLKGVVWHHDKTHSFCPLNDMKDLVAELRSSFGLWSLPFIAGETPNNHSLNTQLAALSTDVHSIGVASAKGLATTKEGHFDGASVNLLGQRFAEQMLKVQTENAEAEKRRRKRQPNYVDSHVHAWSAREGGLDAVARWMEQHNIRRCIVSPIGHSRARTAKQRTRMLANFEKYRGRIDRFCIIEPDEVNSVEEAVAILKKEIADGAIGFGEHYGKNLMFDDPKNMRLYAACEQVDLPVLFHIDQYQNMDERGLPRVERVLREFPKCTFIAHAYWWLHLPEGTCDRLLQKYSNLYADISGVRVAGVLNRDRTYTRKFLSRNADRILFGSDAGWWSFEGKPEVQFTILEELDLPVAVRTKIYRINAERLFGF